MRNRKMNLPLIFYLGVLIVNALANIWPINGITTGQVSDLIPSLFTPVGFTFAIWGVIYLLLGYWVLVPVRHEERLSSTGSTFFVISCIANMVWIFLWHYQIWWATEIAMLVILGSLIGLSVEMSRSRYSRGAAMTIPISVYLGWISVATIANTSIFLITRGFTGGNLAVFWTMGTMIVALLLGVIGLRFKRDWAFATVIIWANFGIFSRWQGVDLLLSGTAFATMVLLALGILLVLVRRKSMF
ncbi:hypothetical protein SANA_26260 [Gottschalkiaceae bacterium SANA]|nr:hypothetical protein SANA_26260 [Gottschalkiaceae bacterium SANA]